MKIARNGLIILVLAVMMGGCNPPNILISRRRPFNPAKIRSIAFIPFYGDVTNCAMQAQQALEATLINFFTRQGTKIVHIDSEVHNALPDIIGVAGLISKEKAREIGQLFDVDAFIAGSISECHYYDPDIGDGMVYLTIKIYNGRTGSLLLHADGRQTVETASEPVSRMTIDIVESTFEILQWK